MTMTPEYIDNLALTFIAIAAFLTPLALIGMLVEGVLALIQRRRTTRPYDHQPIHKLTND